jgi:hypothetical protein
VPVLLLLLLALGPTHLQAEGHGIPRLMEHAGEGVALLLHHMACMLLAHPPDDRVVQRQRAHGELRRAGHQV